MNLPYAHTPCPQCGRYSNRGLAVDAIIVRDGQVLLIERKNDPYKGHWATPGGFVDFDETVEQALAREVKEETGLTVKEHSLLRIASDPARDPRQVVCAVFLVTVPPDEVAVAGDDANSVCWFSFDAIPKELAFDHGKHLSFLVP